MKTYKKGFTLTEILLAVMIVGIIGVALAALTTAATRESGRGRSKMIMRDNLSLLMRQLRQDMHESNQLLYARGSMSEAESSTRYGLLALAKDSVLESGSNLPGQHTPTYILYCFQAGTVTTRADGGPLIPKGLAGTKQTRDGGVITRYELTELPQNSGRPVCSSVSASPTLRVPNVKFISSAADVGNNEHYPVPLFSVRAEGATDSEFTIPVAQTGANLGAKLKVRLIVETPSVPVLNDAAEETISLRSGFEI